MDSQKKLASDTVMLTAYCLSREDPYHGTPPLTRRLGF